MDAYSELANVQLDELERRAPGLYEAVMDTCEFIFDHPEMAQSRSRAVTTAEGMRMVLAVDDHPSYQVFWSTEMPRTEAVIRYTFTSR